MDKQNCTLGASVFLIVFVIVYSLIRNRNKTVKRNEWEAGNTPEVIIVGAGVAGAALAHTLAKDGCKVHVIERDLSEPDRIVGEHLQPGGYLKLIELGLEDCLKDIDAQESFGYALFKDGKHTMLSFPLEDFEAGISGWNFHNGRFIQRMRQKAASLPNVRLEQGTVTSLVKENGVVKGVKYKTKDGQECASYAPLTIVCDGCFSNLRRSLSDPKINVSSYFVSLVLENCQLPHKNHSHVVLPDPSPLLLYQISSTEVRCFIDVPGLNPPSISNGEMANYLRSVVAPQIPLQLQDAFFAAIDKGNIRTMPNRRMPANPDHTPGAMLLGDALNMRHPLSGGGMTVALSDTVLLRNLLRPLHKFPDPQTLSKYLESFHTLRKPMASTINILADGLYGVFSGDQVGREIQQVAFDYLSLGGIFSKGPLALLSGLNPSPMILLLHFLGLVIFGFGRLLLPFPSPQRICHVAKLLWVAARVILPIIWAEGVRQTFFPAIVPAYYRSPPVN